LTDKTKKHRKKNTTQHNTENPNTGNKNYTRTITPYHGQPDVIVIYLK